MGWFRHTGECVGVWVWVVGPDRDVGGCGAQLAGLGGVCSPLVHREHMLTINILCVYIYTPCFSYVDNYHV
jgi:hypothetical protein